MALAIAPELWPITLWISCGVNSFPGAGPDEPEPCPAARRAWRRRFPAADRGLQRPPRLRGLLGYLVQPGQRGAQVSATGQDGGCRVSGGADPGDPPGQVGDEGRVGRIAGFAAAVRFRLLRAG
jgi:hypothetical protein